jgi:glutathione S-transferase
LIERQHFMQPAYPVLYSFRRCPYAIRARMTLLCSGIRVELREVVLRDMPVSLLECSPKATVPVLKLPDGCVIDESRDIMEWALAENDPQQWLASNDEGSRDAADRLIDENDDSFKRHLDRYKYADRHPQQPASVYRSEGERFLQRLERRLQQRHWLLGERIGVADVAIFPFVRQFALVDKPWFDDAPYPRLRAWLNDFLESALFLRVMKKYPQWQEGDAITLFPD